MIYILDSVMEEIKEQIGNHLPERGGALLGEPGKPFITKFLFDTHAFTTSSIYCPSRRLNKRVKEVEEKEGLEYKGIIHSHPNQYDEPSSQDIVELATGLELNPHMPYYLAPIVTTVDSREPRGHELTLDEMKVSFFAGFPSEDRVTMKEMEVKQIPEVQLTRDLVAFCQERSGLHQPVVFMVANDNEPMLAGKMDVEDQFELLFLVDLAYPNSSPRILLTYKNGNQEEIEPNWNIETPFMELLAGFIKEKTDSYSPAPSSIKIQIASRNDTKKEPVGRKKRLKATKKALHFRLSKAKKLVLEEK